MALTEERVLEALRTVMDPELGKDLALELEAKGYAWLEESPGGAAAKPVTAGAGA